MPNICLNMPTLKHMFFAPTGAASGKGRNVTFLFCKSLFHKGETIKHPSQETVPVQREEGVWSGWSGPSAQGASLFSCPQRSSSRSPGPVRIEGKDTSWVQSARGPTLLTRDPRSPTLPLAPGLRPQAGAHPTTSEVGLGTAALTRPAYEHWEDSLPAVPPDPWVLGPTPTSAGRKGELQGCCQPRGKKTSQGTQPGVLGLTLGVKTWRLGYRGRFENAWQPVENKTGYAG